MHDGDADAPAGAMRLVVRGRVQGVGFRWFVRETARAAGLAGWVRNDVDGSVELAAAGPVQALSALRASVSHGPPGSRVTEVEELPVGDDSLPFPFMVQR